VLTGPSRSWTRRRIVDLSDSGGREIEVGELVMVLDAGFDILESKPSWNKLLFMSFWKIVTKMTVLQYD